LKKFWRPLHWSGMQCHSKTPVCLPKLNRASWIGHCERGRILHRLRLKYLLSLH
jgi:hypothetical protein